MSFRMENRGLKDQLGQFHRGRSEGPIALGTLFIETSALPVGEED